ncbi:MAG: transcriptional regulator [Nitriliruptorales bacterium]
MPESYAERVGARLRRIRQQRGMSLQDVERASTGEWKAAVVGSYERGDRNISAARLCELAEFYGVSPGEVVPAEDVPKPPPTNHGIMLDLSKLSGTERWTSVRRYLESIQVERGDFNQQVLSVRSEDLRALSVLCGVGPEELLEEFRQSGVLRAA